MCWWLRAWFWLTTSLVYQCIVLLLVRLLELVGLRAPRRIVVILTHPRSGSTMLLNHLASHPRVLCHGEVLNPAQTVYGDVMGSGKTRQR